MGSLRNAIGRLVLAAVLGAPAPLHSSYSPDARVLLKEAIVSSAVASVDFTDGIDSRYSTYVFEFWGAAPVDDNQALQVQVATGCPGACSWVTGSTEYQWGVDVIAGGGWGTEGAASAGGMAMTGTDFGAGNAANETASGTIKIFGPGDSGTKTRARWRIFFIDYTNDFVAVDGHGIYKTAAAVSGFRFLFASGNIATGTFRLYGMR